MAIQKLASRMKVTAYDFDPDSTDLTDVAWVDMRDYENILVKFFRTVGTSDVVFKIIANTASDGSGTDVVLKTSTADPDATGDYAFLEANAEDIAAAGDGYRYVSAQVSVATDTDEGVVTYIRGIAKRQEENLTADVIA